MVFFVEDRKDLLTFASVMMRDWYNLRRSENFSGSRGEVGIGSNII